MSAAEPTIETMFESVIGPEMRVGDDSVHVWTAEDQPARVVYQHARWRVLTSTPIVEIPDEYLHPLISHPPEHHVGWRCVLRREGIAETIRADLRRRRSAWTVEVI